MVRSNDRTRIPAHPGSSFRPEFLDFERGIRMGHLEPEERITQILKAALAERHGIRFICDRWGRGVHWQWICWVPEPARKAKPISSGVNFGCAKYYIMVDREERVFQSGMQIERAALRAGRGSGDIVLADDWDWHSLLRRLRPSDAFARDLRRRLADGFVARAGAFESLQTFRGRRFPGVAAVARACRSIPADEWGGFQLFYPMPEEEVRATPGPEIVEAILAVFDALAPMMNRVLQVPCLRPPR